MINNYNKKLNIEKIIAFIFSISYFLSLYNVPGTNINAGYFPLLFILFIFLLFKQKKTKYVIKNLAWKLYIFMGLYLIMNHLFIERTIIFDSSATNTTRVISLLLFIFMFMKAFGRNDKIVNYYIYYVENVTIVMCTIVLIQCIFFYIFGTSITYDRSFLLPFKSFFDQGTKVYVESTPMVINGVFRPSSFFLEPAHFSQYCSIGLASILIKQKSLLNKKAIYISICMVLTTSGLGIACVAFLWMISLLINEKGITERKIIRIIIGIFLALIAFIVAFTFSKSFQSSVIRIFVPSNGYNSGIEGRLWSRSFLESLLGKELIFGMGFKNIPVYGKNKIPYYMTGIIEMFYCQGIIGFSIFILFLILMIINTKKHFNNRGFIILSIFLPFFVCSSCLNATTLCGYLPYLYIYKNRNKTKRNYFIK